MGRKKKEIASVVDRLCHNCPREYFEVYEQLNIMTFDSQPNYGKIIDLLSNVRDQVYCSAPGRLALLRC